MKIMENWKSIDGYKGLYEVSNLGRVRSLDRIVGNRWGKEHMRKGYVMTSTRTSKGYLGIQLFSNGIKKSFKTHRLVASAFIPNPLNLDDVNHKDFDKSNNNVENLEWMSKEDNMQHARIGGRKAKKLTMEIAREIRAERAKGVTYRELVGMFECSINNVFRVVNNTIWVD